MSLRHYIMQQNEQQMFGVACVGDDFWCSSACLELDQTAQIISYEEYHPFGTTSYRSGRTETEVSLKRYKYLGKERDEETGLYYYGARYYAAWICRFVSVDPLQFEYPYYTPYQYAGNKPISYIDLDGLEEAKPKMNDSNKKNRVQITKGKSVDGVTIPDNPSKLHPPMIDPSSPNYLNQVLDVFMWVSMNSKNRKHIPITNLVNYNHFRNNNHFERNITQWTDFFISKQQGPKTIIQHDNTKLIATVHIVNYSNLKIDYYFNSEGKRLVKYSSKGGAFKGYVSIVIPSSDSTNDDTRDVGITVKFDMSDPTQFEKFKYFNQKLGGLYVAKEYNDWKIIK